MPDLPPVPDGLADRLREVVRDCLQECPPWWLVSEATEHVVAAVAAALASPPAAPTGEPDQRHLWTKNPAGGLHCKFCGVDRGSAERGELCAALAAPAPSGETAGTPEFLVEAPEHAPYADAYALTPVGSGETAERAKALLREDVSGRLQRVGMPDYESLADVAVDSVLASSAVAAALASAGLLSSPAQTPAAAKDALALAVLARERLLARLYDYPVINLAREDGYGDLADSLTAALGPLFKYAARALAASPAQTPEPDERQRRYEQAVYHDVTACDDGKCPICVAYQRGFEAVRASAGEIARLIAGEGSNDAPRTGEAPSR